MKTTTKENEHKGKTTADLAEQMMKSYEHAVQAGLKIQDEAVKCYGRVMNQAALSQDWQKCLGSFTGTTNGFLPETQKRAEEILEWVEKNTSAGAGLLKKALEAAQSHGLADSQTKWLEFWTASMRSLQTNTEAVAQMQNRTLDSWVGLMRRNADQARTANAAG